MSVEPPLVPNAVPVTRPDVEFTVAMVGSVVLHTPPADTSCSNVVDPVHTLSTPVIGFTVQLTVMVTEPFAARLQPRVSEGTVPKYTIALFT